MERILNIPFNKLNLNDILELVKNTIISNKKLQIITLNTEMIMIAHKDEEFREVIEKAGLVIPESSGLQLAWEYKQTKRGLLNLVKSGVKAVAGKNLEDPLEIIPGVDLAFFLVGMCEEFGYKLMLVGGREGTALTAAQKMRAKFRRLDVKASWGGNFKNTDSSGLIAEINSYKPDILFVALGAPRQEKWIAAHLPDLESKVVMGVGGTLDYWSEGLTRAPEVVRRLGLEWLFRLVRQPGRAKRQMSLIKFLWKLSKEKSPQDYDKSL